MGNKLLLFIKNFSDYQKMTSIFLMGSLMILSSCSNKSERSKVVLEIDNSIISDFQKSSVSAKDATSGDGPGWGLNDLSLIHI